MNVTERLMAAHNALQAARANLVDMESHALALYQGLTQHEQVKAFHKAVGFPIPDKPTFEFNSSLHLRLIQEELGELIVAIESQDMPGFVDAVCDLLYVVHGIALAAGILHLQPFFEEVHRTNLLKVGAGKRADGKALKPEGWEPPRIKEMLEERYSA